MKPGIKISLYSLIFLAAVSCGKENLVEPAPPKVLRSIAVEEETITLSTGKTHELHFVVDEAGFSFDLSRDVVLYNTSSQAPSAFSLQSVRQDGADGRYCAVVQDNSSGSDYSLQVRLGIRLESGKEIFLFSSLFTIRGEDAGLHGVSLHTGLPTVYLDTEASAPIVSKENFLTAALSIRNAGEWNVDELSCQVRGRGNTTWWWPKKPYLIKLDKKAPVLGMPKHKRWVLLANFLDRTLMRNLVAMRVASFTRLDWTPRCQSVELVLNGKHQGTYLLIEQVRVDNDRVPITEMTAEDNDGEALTGGYLLESDFHYDNLVQWMDPHGGTVQWGSNSGIPFGIKYPDEDEITPQQLNYIKQYIYDTAEALYGENFTDPEEGYAKYIDVDSFVDYWIVFEVMGNHELGNPGSVFTHKDRGGKLKAGPCWDFDWGVLSYNTSPQARTGLINGHAIWYNRLFQDPAFREKVRIRFQELLPRLETIPAYMEELEEQLEASAKLNFGMWNPAEDASMNGGRIINGDENMSFHSAVERIKSIYEDRLTVIPKNL